MPVIITILIAKLLLKLSRWLGRGGGSALPGLVAERLDPAIGAKLARNLSAGSIVITGTNGKTTTAKMVGQILGDAGEHLVSNRAGSNLSRGVVSALVEHADWRGRFAQGARGLFEVDEAAMPAVCAMVRPQELVVLNLFRDQLDRYGELDTTAKLIGKGIVAAGNAQLFLNADDPLVASLAVYAKPERVTFFGVDKAPATKLTSDITADSNTCPICGRALVYRHSFFGHIGHYRCKEGHFDRPKPAFAASNITIAQDAISGVVKIADTTEPVTIQLPLPGLYNLYNALAATSLTVSLGIDSAHVVQSLQQVEAAFGRVEKLKLKGRTIYLLLVKNPTGFNQVIQTFLLQQKQQNLLICINDNSADGRDVSWLWDVAFEELKPQQHRIAVSGIRANDMALRLKYADIPTAGVETNLAKALNQFVAQLPANGIGYIIPTYTAMLATRRRLGRLTRLKGMWQ